MKKSRLFFWAAVLGALSTAAIILYLMRDYITGLPFGDDDFSSEDDYDEMDAFTFEDADEEYDDIPVKEKKKSRRGYIPLKFHTAE